MTRSSGFGSISRKAKIGMLLLIIVFIAIIIGFIVSFVNTPPKNSDAPPEP
jgi:hypothetical protein